MCAIKISWNLSPSNCPAGKVATFIPGDFHRKSPSHRWSFSNDQYGQCTGNPYIGWGGGNYMFSFLMSPDVSVDFPNQPIRWLVSLMTMQRGTPSDWMESAPLNLRHQLSLTCSGLKSWMRFMTSCSMSMSCQTVRLSVLEKSGKHRGGWASNMGWTPSKKTMLTSRWVAQMGCHS